MEPPVAVAVAAVAGRMGKALVSAMAEHPELQLAAAVGREGAEYLGQDAGILAGGLATGVRIGGNLEDALGGVQVLVEFSPADVALAHVRLAAEAGVATVLGSTGFSSGQMQELQHLGRKIPMVVAPNMSVGVNVLLAFLPAITAAMGPGYDIEILEAHHGQKRDAPSGTALALGRAAAAGRGAELDEIACLDRNSIPGPREKGSIGFATLRAADVVGEHSVWIAGAGERLELVHRAGSRRNFAEGALRAAGWIAAGRRPGLYDMQDVLGLHSAPSRKE